MPDMVLRQLGLHELLGQQGAPDALDWPVHWL
jgi:hypothetical protein